MTFSVFNAQLGETIEVEARSTDSAGHLSSVLSTSVVIGPVPQFFDDTPIQAAPGPGDATVTIDVGATVDGQAADDVEGARVTLTRNSDGQLTIDDTNSNGDAVFDGLLPGDYTVTGVGAPSFADAATPNYAFRLPPIVEEVTDIVGAEVFLQACEKLGDRVPGGPEEYCDLTPGERAYFRSNFKNGVKFIYDGGKAILLTNQVFPNTTHGDRDDTRASAFQHSVWNALMSISANPTEALEYSTAHETTESPSSTMDVHNNKVGAEFIEDRLWGPDDKQACVGMRRASTTAKWTGRGDPRPLQLTFIDKTVAGGGVRPRPNMQASCEISFP